MKACLRQACFLIVSGQFRLFAKVDSYDVQLCGHLCCQSRTSFVTAVINT